MNADDLLARTKQLLGITDDTHDAEVEALIAVALAAARTYTHRWLFPPSYFHETWYQAAGCCTLCGQCAPILVAEIPPVVVQEVKRDGQVLDPTTVIITPAGKLCEKQGDLVFPIAPFRALELTYSAGYVELPADLGEAVCQVAAAAGTTSTTAAGAPEDVVGDPITKMTIFDVGSVEYLKSGAFYSSLVKSAENAILGPWASVLDGYVDYGKALGGPPECIHTIDALGETIATPAQALPAPASIEAFAREVAEVTAGDDPPAIE